MTRRFELLSGIGMAGLGVAGLAGGGLLWTFQGKIYGLSTTLTALVVLAISLVLLKPLPAEPLLEPSVVDADQEVGSALSLQLPEVSLVGALLAAAGTFGLAASGLAWNFQGLALGLTGTITSIAALAFSLLFLWPVGGKSQVETTPQPAPVSEPIAATATVDAPPEPVITTAEAIRAELAAAQADAPSVNLSNFAPDFLLPGRTLPQPNRKAGPSLGRYRDMVDELFRS
ncbi:MAG: hypothetical protein CL861_03060 [Cyanobium sp. MED843]|nr:hypothetical protein [Cyanobium sp. MED843]OUW29766.1 MAG: hypothetical protein CBD37_02750 [Cyanobacteria bacterium TMED177]